MDTMKLEELGERLFADGNETEPIEVELGHYRELAEEAALMGAYRERALAAEGREFETAEKLDHARYTNFFLAVGYGIIALALAIAILNGWLVWRG